jgi:hypothetical protein
MDGRVQLPVIQYLRKRFNTEYVDSITEPGPILILSEQEKSPLAASILNRVDVSVKKHGSRKIALVAHHDCAGNPKSKEIQLRQLEKSLLFLRKHYPNMEFIGLWVDEKWEVDEVISNG